MSDPKALLPPKAPLPTESVVVDRDDFSSVILPGGLTINLSRHEQLTSNHQSISPEVMSLGMVNADASKEIARFKYAVPAQEKTSQVRMIGIVVILVAMAAFVAICINPAGGKWIATVAGIVVGVFGGLYGIDALRSYMSGIKG